MQKYLFTALLVAWSAPAALAQDDGAVCADNHIESYSGTGSTVWPWHPAVSGFSFLKFSEDLNNISGTEILFRSIPVWYTNRETDRFAELEKWPRFVYRAVPAIKAWQVVGLVGLSVSRAVIFPSAPDKVDL